MLPNKSHTGPARCVMVLGTTSGAGKSWLTTALCRWYANQGLKVAPFKAQNMSNNARVVAGVPGGAGEGALGDSWGEIGSAQYFQALAARAEPDVRMNPLLLKPEADTHSQVVLMGRVSRELSDTPWRGRSLKVWPHIAAALDALRAENDVVVIEGAGSPAEINLYDSDIVNMRVARHANAACLLVSDIDRGGAFAHLYGTWALLPEADRALIKGFVLNKFRGDASLLAPAPQMLQDLTGIPTVATIPMQWHHGLPEEDGVFDDAPTLGAEGPALPPEGAAATWGGPALQLARSRTSGAVRLTVAVVAYPRISNLDEFQPLKNVPGVRLVWARTPADLAGADWVVLPGSKSTVADLAWLRQQGLDAAVCAHASGGGAVLGICGGLQMLGEAIVDPLGVESQHALGGDAPGLGLLPLVTAFGAHKAVRRTHTRFGDLAGPWAPLSGVAVSGYEIHLGDTAQHPAMAATGDVAQAVLPGGLGWNNPGANVLGVYLHGLFEDPAVLQALFGGDSPTLENALKGLALTVDTCFDSQTLMNWVGR
jgi:adenosylcobyric acid synthase